MANKWYTAEIPMKLPSLNDYILACRANRYKAAKMKKDTEAEIIKHVSSLPTFDRVWINFTWIEKDARRDPDNVAFAKKFILDALVKCGRIPDDSQKYVAGFLDNVTIGKETKVVVDIRVI